MKASEKALNDEKNILAEKVKMLKNEIIRKEQMIKEMKDRLDETQAKGFGGQMSSEETERLKDQVKKMKGDLERKEVNLKNTKSKLDQALSEIDQMKTENINKTTMSLQEIDKETRRHDQTKLSLKKIESQYNMLLYLVKRLFRENAVNCQKIKNKQISQQQTLQLQQ